MSGFTTCLLAMAAVLGQESQSVEIPFVVLQSIDEVEVPARDHGILVEVPAETGQAVRAGELLARIDDTEARIAHNRAELQHEIAMQKAENDVDLRYARKAHEVDQADVRRADEALRQFPGSISATDYDRLVLTAERSALAIEQMEQALAITVLEAQDREFDLGLAEHQIERRQLTAPFDGVLMEVRRQAYEWVEPGEAVFRVLGLDRLRAEGLVNVEQTSRLRVGAPARLTVTLPNGEEKQFSGRVIHVGRELEDPISGDVRIWTEIQNPKHELLPGLRGNLSIDVSAATDEAAVR